MGKRSSACRCRWTATPLVVALAFVPALPTPEASAAEYAITAEPSIFAVLTHKAGIGSGLAHDHLIVAARPAMRLEFEPGRPEGTTFTFTVAAGALEIDAPAARAAWKGRFKELGIHSGDLPPVSESDRRKVRAAMLGESQLDEAKFPEIRAEVTGLARRDAKATAQWTVQLRLTIHGKTIERSLPATFSAESNRLSAEIVGEFLFSEFGIEPYSTMLGAIRNDDRFHLFVQILARAVP